jgi:hypothetical protein
VSQYDAMIAEAERRHGLPSGLLHGLARTESGFNPNAVSPKGAIGIMQFMPATAQHFGIDPHDPAQSIEAAAQYMADNLKASNGNVAEALRLYQGGPNVAKRGPENAAYAGKVFQAMPGDSGKLTQMGFGAPPSSDSNPDADKLAQGGFVAPPPSAVQRERGEINAFVPAPAQLTQGINGIIAQGVKARKTDAQIKQDVRDFNLAHGLQDGPTGNLQAAINWHRNGGQGAIPVVQPGGVKPLTTTQKALAGLKQGVTDVDATFDPIAQTVERKVPGLTSVDSALGLSTADQSAAYHAKERNLFGTTLGNDFTANAGRIGGNIAASAPFIMTGNAYAGGANKLISAASEPVANFLAGTGGGNLLTRGASLATNGALQGAEGAAITSGASNAPLSEQLTTGALIGGALSPASRIIGAGYNAAADYIAPTIPARVGQLADKAVKAGIDLRGSQISQSPFIRQLDSVLAHVPGSGIAADNAAQRAQFTRAVGRTFGADSDELSPHVMETAKNNISQIYKDVSARTNILADPDFLANLDNVGETAKGYLDTTHQPTLDRLIANIKAKVTPEGVIPGEAFQALTQKGSMLDRATQNGNPAFAQTAKQIKAQLNDALQASAAPEDAAALQDASLAWKNMRTVENAINPATYQVTPGSLQRPVNKSYGNRVYTGAGDIGDLADAGKMFLVPEATTNTAERGKLLSTLYHYGNGLVGLGAASLGYREGLEPLYIGMAGVGGATGAAALGKATGATLSADWYRNKLIQAATDQDAQLAAKTGTGPYAGYFIPPAAITGNALINKSQPQPAQ